MTIAVNPTGLELANPNIIIGGNFDTNPWQRQVSFTNPGNGIFTADRFSIARSDDSQFNILKTADAPTLAESGFYSANCYHLDVTTADGTIGAAQYCAIRYNVEGYDIAPIGFGQTGAKKITLSFWHKHTVTGTYCVGFANSGNNRSYIAEYTQAVADTWEKATITITADTTGTWLYTNGVGLSLWFTVAAGTDWQNTANQWNATLDFASASQVNGLSNAANNFKLSQVKLEIGAVATPYPMETEMGVLARSQRYYFKSYDQGVYPGAVTNSGNVAATSSGTAGTGGGQNGVNMTSPFPVTMRAQPTCTIYNPSSGTSGEFNNEAGGADIAGAAGYIGQSKATAVNTGACADQTIYTTHLVADAEL